VPALLLAPSNRHVQAWLVLGPVVTVYIVWAIVQQVLPFPSLVLSFFTDTVTAMVLALSVLWLMSGRLASHGRRLAFVRAAVILVAVAAASPVVANLSFESHETIPTLILSVMGVLVVLGGITAALRRCRKVYTDRRFMIYVPLCTIAAVPVLVVVWTALALAMGASLRDVPEVLLIMLVSSAIYCGVVYLIALPFVMLALRTPFYRHRLQACAQIEAMRSPHEPEAQARA
jgi:hypothetical protein